MASVAGLFVVGGLFGAQASRKRPEAPADLHRGRVAHLSAPHGTGEFRTVTELVEAIEPSVIQIETDRGMGSGFILDETGLAVTCHHCIQDVTWATAVFANGERVNVLGICKLAPDHDLAIIQIGASTRLRPLPLAADEPKKGAPVVAFGSPAGLSFTVSEGSVSSLRRGEDLIRLDGPFGGLLRGDKGFDISPDTQLIQITSTTMPGNSGGPVVDFSGNVVGISSFILQYHARVFEFLISAQQIRGLADEPAGELIPLISADEAAVAKILDP